MKLSTLLTVAITTPAALAVTAVYPSTSRCNNNSVTRISRCGKTPLKAWTIESARVKLDPNTVATFYRNVDCTGMRIEMKHDGCINFAFRPLCVKISRGKCLVRPVPTDVDVPPSEEEVN